MIQISSPIVIGSLSLIGGGVAYFRKGSVPSLMGSGFVSVLYFLAAYLMHRQNANGLVVALVASSVLTAAGLARCLSTKFEKPVPIALATIGFLSSCYYAFFMI